MHVYSQSLLHREPQKQNFLRHTAAYQNLSAVRIMLVPRLFITENDASYKSNIHKNRMM